VYQRSYLNHDPPDLRPNGVAENGNEESSEEYDGVKNKENN